jgi:hypothetical protein
MIQQRILPMVKVVVDVDQPPFILGYVSYYKTLRNNNNHRNNH